MMDPVLFLDSGMGGLPYYEDFHKQYPAVPAVYAADRAGFPYGPRKKDALIGLLTGLVDRLLVCFSPQLVVLACNTASVSALEALRKAFPALPFVGTVPAVKPAVEASRTRRVGVLGTSRTVEDPYIVSLAAQYGKDCTISVLAAPELVDFVERRFEEANREERLRAVRPAVEYFRADGADGIVLGCTHFLLLREEFCQLAGPYITIYDSMEGITRRIGSLLAGFSPASPVPADPASSDSVPENLLVLTGSAPPEPVWRKRAERFGLSLCLLDEAL